MKMAACCGDTPTLETMAAVTILRDELPELKIRVVNVVDLFKMESDHKHPHGLSDAEYGQDLEEIRNWEWHVPESK